MSRFYLHTRRGDIVTPDDEGSELPDIAAARTEAMASAREVLAQAIWAAKDDVPDSFIIADANGRELETVLLSEALPKHLRK